MSTKESMLGAERRAISIEPKYGKSEQVTIQFQGFGSITVHLSAARVVSRSTRTAKSVPSTRGTMLVSLPMPWGRGLMNCKPN